MKILKIKKHLATQTLSILIGPLVGLSGFALMSSCAHHHHAHDKTQVTHNDRELMNDDNALRTEVSDGKTMSAHDASDTNSISDHMIVRFAPGQYNLSRADRTRLGDLIESGNNNMHVDRVKVAAWSFHVIESLTVKFARLFPSAFVTLNVIK